MLSTSVRRVTAATRPQRAAAAAAARRSAHVPRCASPAAVSGQRPMVSSTSSPRADAPTSRSSGSPAPSSSSISASSSSSSPRGSSGVAAAAAAFAAALLLTAAPPPPGALAAGFGANPALGELAALAAAPQYDADGDDIALDQYNSDMEQLAADELVDPAYAMPPELRDFLALFEKGTPKDLGKLEAARARAGFRRGPDGRVTLLSGGEEFAVKADAQAPGYLLLRDSRGYCYYLPADPSGRLAQIDLSDDLLVAQLFASGAWEEVIEPLEVMAAPRDGESNASSAAPVQLRLGEAEWRGLSSLLAGASELAEEPLEDLEGEP